MKTTYFDSPGPHNTEYTLELAKQRSLEGRIRNIVVASTTGTTGVKASKLFQGFNLIVVTHVTGFREPNIQELQPENEVTIEKNGGKILTTTHAFGGLGRAVHRRFGAIQVDEVVANVLRLFGEGVKVAIEVACMATDAGLINKGSDVISIGGSSRGADTAILIKPSNTHSFFDTRIQEIICKPRLSIPT
ncbi:MAG: hypothetical protein JSV35_06060 [Candidatus Bathyarchaeota archaeon]|nr:MAG: hypothetical protein JSV35_06060 [Candidatus Bathyarchaeota archaeon]